MMGLDVLRALRRHPATRDALLSEIGAARGADARLDGHARRLEQALDRSPDELELDARRLMSMMAIGLQASLLLRSSTPEVADAFIGSRIAGEGSLELGTLPTSAPTMKTIVDRAWVGG